MGPRQLSHQRCDFLVIAIGFVELPHAKEVGAREASQSRLRIGQVGRQLRDNSVAPLRSCKLAADVFPNLPIEVDQRRVDRVVRPIPGGLDQGNDLGEARIGWHLRLAADFHAGLARPVTAALTHAERV